MNPSNPLNQLRDLHLPSPISWWPLAPGWYLLAGFLLIALMVIAWFCYKHWQYIQKKRAVLAEFNRYMDASPPTWGDINLLLKRVAFIHHPREKIAGLQGEAWLRWLDKQSTIPCIFTEGTGRILLTGPYEKHTPVTPEVRQLLEKTLIQLLTISKEFRVATKRSRMKDERHILKVFQFATRRLGVTKRQDSRFARCAKHSARRAKGQG